MHKGAKVEKPIYPKETANIASLITFFYSFNLCKKGYGQDLKEDDLYEVLRSCKSETLGDQLEAQWERGKKNHEIPSLLRVLFACFGKKYLARVNLARALYKDADIYLLDDCLTALDGQVSDYIFKSILEFLKEKICLFVCNNHRYIKAADVVITITEAGVVVMENQDKDTFEFNNQENVRCKETITEESSVKMYQEDHKSGVVNINLYKKYIVAGGGYVVFSMILLIFVIVQAVVTYSEQLVSNWVTLEQNLLDYPPNATNFIVVRKKYERADILNVYTILIIASTGLSLIKALSFFSFNRRASIYLHKVLLSKIINAKIAFFDLHLIGNVLNRFSKDLCTIDEYLPLVMNECFEVFFTTTSTILLVSSVKPIFLVPGVLFFGVAYSARHFYLRTGRSLQRLDSSNTPVGDVGMAMTQAFHLSGVLHIFIRRWAEYETQMTAVERLVQYTDIEQEENAGKVLDQWPRRGQITYENVSLQYTDRMVLKNLNFTVKPGQKIGVVGRTGAGKSSIISTLFRLYDIEGVIKIDGVNTKNLCLNFLRSNITIIPQDPVLISGTIRDNVDPYGQHSDTEIWRVLQVVNLENLTNLNEMVSCRLSPGQKQLICLARAIIRNNKIVVLDEPTANLDNETDALIQNVLRRIFCCCTLVVVAHRMKSILDSDVVMVVDDGKIVELDKPRRLLRNKKSFFFEMLKQN